MPDQLYIPISRNEFRKAYGVRCINKNFANVLQSIAYKYGMIINDTPCMKQVKVLVQMECGYLGATVSLKQISALINPRHKFPATAGIILMAV